MPYQSVYSKQYMGEISQHLTEKYEENQEDINLINQFLATFNHSPASGFLVSDVQEKIEGMFNTIIETGAYERATNVIAKAQNLINTDPGLIAANEDWKVREKELAWMAEANQDPNKQVIDFGEGEWDNHVSFHYDENQQPVRNEYRGKAEIMGDYNNAKFQMIKSIPSDSWGVDDTRLDNIAESLVAAYITDSPVGNQEYRKLMMIDFAHVEDEDMKHKMAVENIKNNFRNLLEQYKHTKIVDAEKKNSGYVPPNGSNVFINPDSHRELKDVAFNSQDFHGKIMETNVKLLEQMASGEYYHTQDNRPTRSQMDDARFLYSSNITNALSASNFSEEEINEHTRYLVHNFDGHEEFGSLVDFMTLNHEYFDMNYDTFGPTGQPAIDTKWMIGGAAVGTTAWTINKIWNYAKGGTSKLNLLKSLLVGTGGAMAVKFGDAKLFDSFNNVRDILRPENADAIYNYIPGSLDSEQEVLVYNLMDIDRVNKLLGTDYEMGPQYEKLINNAVALLTYRQEGGDKLDGIVNDYTGPIFNAEMYTGNYLFGKDTGWSSENRNNLNAQFNTYTLDDFDFLGLPENSPAYNEFFDIDENDPQKKKGGKTIEYIGVTTPDPLSNVPIYFKVRVNGNTVAFARSKPAAEHDLAHGNTIEWDILQKSGLGDVAVLDEARVRLNAVRDRDGVITNMDAFNAITESWEGKVRNQGGYSQPVNTELAKYFAMTYLIQKFSREFPEVHQAAEQKANGDPTVYNMLMWNTLSGYDETGSDMRGGDTDTPWLHRNIR